MVTFNDYILSVFNTTVADTSNLLGRIAENIKWAWDNWDFDWQDYAPGLTEKPETFTDEFASEWIENEIFDVEFEEYKEVFGEDLTLENVEKFLTTASYEMYEKIKKDLAYEDFIQLYHNNIK